MPVSVRRIRVMNKPSTLRSEPTITIQAMPARERKPSNKEINKRITVSEKPPYDFCADAQGAWRALSLETPSLSFFALRCVIRDFLRRPCGLNDARSAERLYAPGLKVTSTVLLSFAANVTF